MATCSLLCGAYACLPEGRALLGAADSGPPGNIDLTDDAALQRTDVALGDPFGIDGLLPTHGPFTGGTRVSLAGRGFSPRLRVWFGDRELPQSSVLASDPTRAAIVTPEGKPGPVDVRIVDDATGKERVLSKGFVYDAFVVVPDSGATSGGTRIALTGSGTAWTTPMIVQVGGKPCADVNVESPTRISCTTPAGSPGAKDITVGKAGTEPTQVREAFTYSDSIDGYRGGLSGGALSGRIKVLALSAATGQPIPSATVIVGESLATATIKKTSATGVAEIDALGAATSVTVTVAAKCQQPTTFVNVPVDTVTTYLSPVLDPACAQGDPPSGGGGGGGRFGGAIEGQLLFGARGVEFKRSGWVGVPEPVRPTERQAAYVFQASGSPAAGFVLPTPAEAITPESVGTTGFAYQRIAFPGNVTLYALAGLEDRSVTPPRFTAYLMGVLRGISVPPNGRVIGADIVMDTLVDHGVTVAPVFFAVGPRGPDRFLTNVAVTLGATGFAHFPIGRNQSSLPLSGNIALVGLPGLEGAVAQESYVISAGAYSGQNLTEPLSVVSRIRTRVANDPITVSGFLAVPVLQEPSTGSWGGTRVQYTSAGQADLMVMSVSSGLSTWTIVAPGGVQSFGVPDLAQLPGDPVGLTRGVIRTSIALGRLEQFSYGLLRYGQLSSASWTALAQDSLSGVY